MLGLNWLVVAFGKTKIIKTILDVSMLGPSLGNFGVTLKLARGYMEPP